MKRTEYYFPIGKHCIVKGCKESPVRAYIELSGTHPMNMEFSAFSFLCKKHKEQFGKYKVEVYKKEKGTK